MLESMALFNGMTQKMGYLQTRQRVLSQNITNSDTPGYQAMEVKTPDFSKIMHGVKAARSESLGLSTTSSAHINVQSIAGRPTAGDPASHTYDVTPSGNSVSMEEQMMSASQNAIDYQLMTNLYNKNLDILRAAMRR